jgi:hypothetical protein
LAGTFGRFLDPSASFLESFFPRISKKYLKKKKIPIEKLPLKMDQKFRPLGGDHNLKKT